MIYAISDIHGCYEQLVEKLKAVDLENDNKIVFLGDYIDYGDNLFKVLECLYKLQHKYGSEKVIVLKGNHEEMFLEWIDEYRNIKSIRGVSFAFNDWLRNDIEDGYKTFNTFVTSQKLEELDGIAQEAEAFDRTNVAAVKMLLNKHNNLISWVRKLPSFYETEQVIFVHAGIDETAGMNWIAGTSEETFLWKYPPVTGMFYKSIISGHVGTKNEALSNDQEFHGVFYDGMSHYYIDGSVYTKTGRLNVVAVDEADGTVYLTDDDKCQKVPAYWNY